MLTLSHVPTYDTCNENCCTPPRIHTTSQVIYLKGSGGLEIHVDDTLKPFSANELIDVDAVFKDKIDVDSYDLYIGCGGCVQSEDPLVSSSKINVTNYAVGEVEPFTQTTYYSVFDKNDTRRKFNASLLSSCNQNHFTIRLVDKMPNRTNPIIWAPVIGLAEKFTFVELLEFPVYILKNHGQTWNNLGYTYWIWLFIGAPVLLTMSRACINTHLYIYSFKSCKFEFCNFREVFYEIALIGFISAACELLTHLIFAQIGLKVQWGFYVGLFVVALLPNILGIIFVITVWRTIYKSDTCLSNPYWAPFEVLTGFSFLFLFGSGLYVGPAAIVFAGLLRFRELCPSKNTATEDTQELELSSQKIRHINITISHSLGFVSK
jgi:hypothetical protein